jgi:hypothetical protein
VFYRIVYEHDSFHLESEVNKLIDEGWRPQGGVSVVPSERGTASFAQAMTFAQPADPEVEWTIRPFWRTVFYRVHPRKKLQLADERESGRKRWW